MLLETFRPQARQCFNISTNFRRKLQLGHTERSATGPLFILSNAGVEIYIHIIPTKLLTTLKSLPTHTKPYHTHLCAQPNNLKPS
jgi:hypothetical protein